MMNGLALGTYVCCCLKDILACPRPSVYLAQVQGQDASIASQNGNGSGGSSQQTSSTSSFAYSGIGNSSTSGNSGSNSASSTPRKQPRQQQTAGKDDLAQALRVARRLQILEHKDESEYGAPSMHMSNSLIMNLQAVFYFSQVGIIPPQYSMSAYALAFAWSAWIGWTRMYLGMHTPIDLQLGTIVGLSFFGLWVKVAPQLLALLKGSGAAGAWATLALHTLLLATYPRPLQHTVSFQFSTTFLGAALGGTISITRLLPIGATLMTPISVHLLQHATALMAKVSAASPAFAWAGTPLLAKVLAGYTFTFVLRTIAKKLTTALAPKLLGLLPKRVRTLWQPPVAEDGCAPGTWGVQGMIPCRHDLYPHDAFALRTFVTYAVVVYAVWEFGIAMGTRCMVYAQ